MDMSSWMYPTKTIVQNPPLFKIHILIVQIMKTMEPVLQAIVHGEVPSAYL